MMILRRRSGRRESGSFFEKVYPKKLKGLLEEKKVIAPWNPYLYPAVTEPSSKPLSLERFRIDLHSGEAAGREGRNKGYSSFGKALHFLGSRLHLRPGASAVSRRQIADPKDPKSKLTDDCLTAFHEVQCLARYPGAVRDAGAKARLGGGIRGRESKPAGEFPDILLGKSRLFKGGDHGEFRRGP